MYKRYLFTSYRFFFLFLVLLLPAQLVSAAVTVEDLEAAVYLYSQIGARRAVDAKACGLFEVADKMKSVTIQFFSFHPISLENPTNRGRITRTWERYEERHRMIACISCFEGEYPQPHKSCKEIEAGAQEFIQAIDTLEYDSL